MYYVKAVNQTSVLIVDTSDNVEEWISYLDCLQLAQAGVDINGISFIKTSNGTNIHAEIFNYGNQKGYKIKSRQPFYGVANGKVEFKYVLSNDETGTVFDTSKQQIGNYISKGIIVEGVYYLITEKELKNGKEVKAMLHIR